MSGPGGFFISIGDNSSVVINTNGLTVSSSSRGTSISIGSRKRTHNGVVVREEHTNNDRAIVVDRSIADTSYGGVTKQFRRDETNVVAGDHAGSVVKQENTVNTSVAAKQLRRDNFYGDNFNGETMSIGAGANFNGCNFTNCIFYLSDNGKAPKFMGCSFNN